MAEPLVRVRTTEDDVLSPGTPCITVPWVALPNAVTAFGPARPVPTPFITVPSARLTLSAWIARSLEAAREWLEEGDVEPTPEAVRALTGHFAAVDSFLGAWDAVPQPHLCLPGDGDISLEWSIGDRKVFLDVFPNGLIRLFAGRIARARTVDTQAWEDPTPEQTAQALCRLTGRAEISLP